MIWLHKTILIAVLFLGLVVITYFWETQPNQSVHSAITSIPTTPLEERICEKVSEQFGDCKNILLFDSHSNLVFVESSSGIIPVSTNPTFTDFKKFIYPGLDFQEFKEEKVERGPIDWRVENSVQKNYSVIYGFAEDDAKTIVINSEGNVQPNKFFVRDNLWVWYVTFQKDKVKLPIYITVYNAKGQLIYGENDKKFQ